MKIDVDNAPAGLQRLRQFPIVRRPVLDMMQNVAEENRIHRAIRQFGIVGGGEHGFDIRRRILLRDLEQLGIDIHGVDFGGVVRETAREIAGAGADIGDDFARLEIERRDDVVRQLPDIALRIFEDPRVLLGVMRRVVLVLGLGGSGGQGRQEQAESHIKEYRAPRRQAGRARTLSSSVSSGGSN